MTALWPHKIDKAPSPGRTVYAMVTDNGSVAVATNAYAAVAMAFTYAIPVSLCGAVRYRQQQGQAAKLLRKNGVVVVSRKDITSCTPDLTATVTRMTTNTFRGKEY